MKSVVVLVCLCASAIAMPAVADDAKKEVIPIISQENTVEHNGKFSYRYESGDGTKSQQEGELKQVDPESAGEAVRGSFSYEGDDGKTYSLTYTADENGYQPQGDFLPTSPPIPPAIQRALDYLATLPPPVEEKKN